MSRNIKFLGVSSGICAPVSRGKLGAEKGFTAIRTHCTDILNDSNTAELVSIKHFYNYISESPKNIAAFYNDIAPRRSTMEFPRAIEQLFISHRDQFVQAIAAGEGDPLQFIYDYIVAHKDEVKATDKVEEADTTVYARHIGYLNQIFPIIRDGVVDSLERGEFPFVIAGDHSTAAGTISGIKKYLKNHGNKKLGVIWVDAHVDAHTPYSTPSGNMHGMPLGMVMDLQKDYRPGKSRDAVADTFQKEWKELRTNLDCTVAPEDVAFIGIRSFEEHEAIFLKEEGIKHFHLPWSSVSEQDEVCILDPADRFRNPVWGGDAWLRVCEQVYAHFAGYDYLYVSFDIDSIDASAIKATGTPEANGLTVQEAKDILGYFWTRTAEQDGGPELIAMELVEYNPLIDENSETVGIIHDILKQVTGIDNFHEDQQS